MAGRFITLEGIEGAGKSTQVTRLAESLRAAGHDVVVTREPGATDVGARIRGLVLDKAESPSPRAEALLYAAERVRQRSGTSAPTDRFEEEPARFFERVRERYLELARAEPTRIRIIDASRGLAEVQAQVAAVLETLLRSNA